MLYNFAKYELTVAKLSKLMKYCVSKKENTVQTCFYTTQISWFSCWVILWCHPVLVVH